MDSDLDEVLRAEIRDHLAVCEPCAKVCEDLAAIIDLCKRSPRANCSRQIQALWCRINNILESEIKPEPPCRRRLSRDAVFGDLRCRSLRLPFFVSLWSARC